jgi:hypothetical protein
MNLAMWLPGASPDKESRPYTAHVGPINHPERNGCLIRSRIIDECERTEPGIDGLARTNLRFSQQGGP